MISIRIKGERKLLKSVENLGSRSHRRELMDTIGSFGVSSTQQRFLDKKSPDGDNWTKSARAKKDGGQTMRDTNRLFESLTHEASPDHVAWGTNVIYAAIHQFGGVIKAKTAKGLSFFVGGSFVNVKQINMPARPFLDVSSEDEAEINTIVDDWIQGAIR